MKKIILNLLSLSSVALISFSFTAHAAINSSPIVNSNSDIVTYDCGNKKAIANIVISKREITFTLTNLEASGELLNGTTEPEDCAIEFETVELGQKKAVYLCSITTSSGKTVSLVLGNSYGGERYLKVNHNDLTCIRK